MVDPLVTLKRSRPPVSSDRDSSGAAPFLRKGTKKRVRKFGAAGSSSQTATCQVAHSMPTTVVPISTCSRHP